MWKNGINDIKFKLIFADKLFVSNAHFLLLIIIQRYHECGYILMRINKATVPYGQSDISCITQKKNNKIFHIVSYVISSLFHAILVLTFCQKLIFYAIFFSLQVFVYVFDMHNLWQFFLRKSFGALEIEQRWYFSTQQWRNKELYSLVRKKFYDIRNESALKVDWFNLIDRFWLFLENLRRCVIIWRVC